VNGARAGCVFCCERDETTAQLRVLLVEPWARGAGLGGRLVDECITFARQAGYSRMMLWTVDMLTQARRIYKRAGFELVKAEPKHQFGFEMMDEIWEMDLTTTEPAVANR
jgi:GNAT superfamily N-acetyltransferase